MSNRKLLVAAVASAVSFVSINSVALEIEEVVVTAQKKEQSINDIGMAITAFSGDAMKELGVQDTTDMAALTPGLTYTQTSFGPPVYTMRGIGFRDTSYNAASTVGVYVDEATIAYPIMTLGAVLDLERAEVLKGPQGTLYGRNNTGGAINYIANKPSDSLEAGLTASYGRYDTLDAEGYLSGPLSDNLAARLAVKTTQSGEGWQKNEVNNDTLGKENETALRLSLAADFGADTDALLQIGWWNNKSEAAAPQIVAPDPSGNAPIVNILAPWQAAFQPNSDHDNDVASWTPGQDLENNMSGSSVTLRLNHALNDKLSLTSVTSFGRFDDDGGKRDVGGFAVPYADADGYLATQDFFNINGGDPISFADEAEYPWLPAFLITNDASIDTFSQEIRLSAEYDTMSWIAGVYYAEDEVDSLVNQYVPITTNTNGIAGNPLWSFDGGTQDGVSETESLGLFVHTEWQLHEAWRLTVGLRYSDDTNEYTACLRDADNGASAAFFGGVLGLGDGQPGSCLTEIFDENGSTGVAGEFNGTLEEDSVSGRINLDWFINNDIMVYANYSRGFKAGSFPNLVASRSIQFEPVTQEKLDAFEVGVKATLLDGNMQLNGSIFHNDYQDKQLMSSVTDPVFGSFRRLVNIPESSIAGAEIDLQWQPTEGLFIALSASYLDTEVKGDFLGSDVNTRDINYGGSKFPYTADMQLTGLVNYSWPISEHLNAFVGFDVSYTDEINTHYEPGTVIAGVDPNAVTRIPDSHVIESYTLVNARAGLSSADEKWRLMLWSRNLTDEFTLNNVNTTIDAVVQYTGKPRTYGLSLEYRFF